MAPLDQPHADTHTAFRGSLGERVTLAGRPDAAPELLVFLAADEAEAVRRAVAGNPGAPSHADRLLAQDAEASIRVSLARKLAAQAVDLARDMADRRVRLAWDALLLLGRDRRSEVRHAVADTLADLPDAPHDLVLALARDAALLVCEPLIRLSAALTVEDLIDLVRHPPGAGSRTAVAQRLQLAEPVSDAVVDSGDVAAMAALLRNPTARITLESLGALAKFAGRYPALREPLAGRSAPSDEVLSQKVWRPDPQLPVAALSFVPSVERKPARTRPPGPCGQQVEGKV